MDNIYHLKPKGGKIERAIINSVNFLIDIVFETIVKPNGKRLDDTIDDTEKIKVESEGNYETLLDTQFELNKAKDELVDEMESRIDLEFRVSKLEDSIGG